MPEKQTYSGPERRKERQAELQSIHRQLRDGEHRMGEFEELLKQNTEVTQATAESVARIEQNTSAFVAFSNDLLGGTRFLCRCARGIQWTAEMVKGNWAILGLTFAIYAYMTNQTKLFDFVISALKP